MDYSIVVGVDYHGQELVVGIVDYIRTYTWDKVLETWVKETVFPGRNKANEPSELAPHPFVDLRDADNGSFLLQRSSRPSSIGSDSGTLWRGTSLR